VADKPTQLILDALGRAMAEPAGLPLHAAKSAPGLFAATTPARQAAQRSKDEGYLKVVRTETRGKTVHEVCALTEKGLAYLLEQVSPRVALEELVRSLQARATQVGELIAAARQAQATFDALQSVAERVLEQVGRPGGTAVRGPAANGSETWKAGLLSYLAQWQTARPSEDCPIPELYRQALKAGPGLTIGHFHDGLRQLRDAEQIYLHPWTGPLYEIPEPAFALLVGHEVAYYASLRTP
jgi:hypothetical protein